MSPDQTAPLGRPSNEQALHGLEILLEVIQRMIASLEAQLAPPPPPSLMRRLCRLLTGRSLAEPLRRGVREMLRRSLAKLATSLKACVLSDLARADAAASDAEDSNADAEDSNAEDSNAEDSNAEDSNAEDSDAEDSNAEDWNAEDWDEAATVATSGCGPGEDGAPGSNSVRGRKPRERRDAAGLVSGDDDGSRSAAATIDPDLDGHAACRPAPGVAARAFRHGLGAAAMAGRAVSRAALAPPPRHHRWREARGPDEPDRRLPAGIDPMADSRLFCYDKITNSECGCRRLSVR